MDDITIVVINGDEYYVAADYVQYLKVINNRLVNIGTQNITLYGSIRESGVNNSGYPRISCSTFQYATYQSANQSISSTLTVNDFAVKSRHFSVDTLLLVVIAVAVIFSWFKRR